MPKQDLSPLSIYMNHMPNAEDFEVKCKHLKTALQCHEVSTEDVKRVREFVYRQPVKTIIDNKIAHLIEVKHPKTKKSEETLTNKGQAIRLDYFLRNINSEKLLVCQKTFLTALKISQRNILTIGKKKAEGQIIARRGGDRRSKKYEQQKNSKISGMQEVKRVHLKRVREKCLTKLEVFCRTDDKKYQNYLKRGAKLEIYQPKQIELRNSIKKIKPENVETLLKNYQEDWEDNETFAWYKNLLNERRHPTGGEEETCPESDDVDQEHS
ncbi:unnamed protein product [Acanthoscelides obtectus]|uniref:Uncharacterized protein n=1 Tax=Acanthoscelides obtectus TaxID=200917 RepID=A0A9P0Q1S4_ACAOB|nr:unnamed protein product [Acanthoscelides obtectus]CAK1671070.1 hypothetical protein AOBTE_LOCUS28036 [Acanthoscelides obtectus]